MFRILFALLILAGTAGAATAKARTPTDETITALAAQLTKHKLILIAEHHRSKQDHAFLQSLITDPRFVCRIDDIVVEFGNGRLQSTADRYVSGEAVSAAELWSVWRGVGQWLTWDSPVYERFFQTIREVNARHLCPRPVRIVLGDPPIDWSAVKNADDYKPFGDRDGYYADVVENEVLAKGHRALLIAGSMHDLKAGPLDPAAKTSPSLAEIIEQRHPGVLFSVWTLPANASLATELGMGEAPSFKTLEGFSNLTVTAILPKGIMLRVTENGQKVWKPMGDIAWPPLNKAIDGLLYLGADEAAVDPSPTIYLDPVYQAELRQRAVVLNEVYGIDFAPELDELITQARKAEGSSPPSN